MTQKYDKQIAGTERKAKALHTLSKKTILATGSPLQGGRGYNKKRYVSLSVSFPGYKSVTSKNPLSASKAEAAVFKVKTDRKH